MPPSDPKRLMSLLRSGGTDQKPTARQLFDIAVLRIITGQGPGYYYTAGLNRRDAGWRDQFGHFNHDEYSRFVDSMNPPEQRRPLDRKSRQKRICKAAGINTPAMLLCSADLENGKSQPGVAECLGPYAGQKVVVKPDLDTGGGRGIRFMTLTDQNTLHDDEGKAHHIRDLDNVMRGSWLIERAIDAQHPWYAALSLNAVNSWRIWIVQPGDDRAPLPILSYLRMSRGTAKVDNHGAGGLLAPLLPDGKFGMITDGSPGDVGARAHPDTGHIVESMAPPEHAKVLAFAADVMRAFGGVRFMGVDIAVTTSGPALIEVNFGPDRIGAARCRVPMKSWLRDHDIAY